MSVMVLDAGNSIIKAKIARWEKSCLPFPVIEIPGKIFILGNGPPVGTTDDTKQFCVIVRSFGIIRLFSKTQNKTGL